MSWNRLIKTMISKEEVGHIAKLARMKMNEQDMERYQKDLGEVLDYFEILKEANTQDVWPMTHALPHENAAREDVARRELPQVVSAMLQLAPAVKDGFFKVKTILSFK